MGVIKDTFKLKADAANADIKDLLKEHGNKVIGEVTLAQVYQGMRGITGLVSETSCSIHRRVSASVVIPFLNCGISCPK
jgi:hypothetical protein